MKICTRLLTIITIFSLQLFTGFILEAQVPIVKSTEKVIIKGNTYYIHTVAKGQTSFSIAKAYSVSVETLHSENPEAVYGLKEGQTLKIPVVAEEPVKETPRVRDTGKYIYHPMAPGETIYSLSRKYDISTSAIMEANPGISPDDIPVGTELAIPKKEFKTESVSLDPQQTEEFTLYRVKEGESLSFIARKFNVTSRELRRMNGGLIFPKPGDLIRIPGKHNLDDMGVIKIDSIIADTLVQVIEIDSALISLRTHELTDISILKGKLDIAVMLPLFLSENSVRSEIDTTAANTRRVRYRPFSWIYPPSVTFLEMYEGILLAAEDLRKSGLDVNIHTYDTRASLQTVEGIIASGKLRNMDLIIGPIYSFNLEAVTRYATEDNIPVISPVPLQNIEIMHNSPTLFLVNPSIYTIQEKLAIEVAQHYESNIVFIYSDTSIVEQENLAFRDMILRELNYKTAPENISFKQVPFRSWSSTSSDTLNRLDHAMNPLKENVVILATEDESAIHETVMNLHNLMKRYNMKIFGYPAVRNLEINIDLNYFCDLEISLYSPFRVDYTNANVNRFILNYRNTFKTEPSETSFAWTGYDITTYFVSGLAMHGKRFLRNPEMHNPELLNSRFDFRRSSSSDGFENKGLLKLKYTKEMELMTVEEPRNGIIK